MFLKPWINVNFSIIILTTKLTAVIGPKPMTNGSIPVWATATIRANGLIFRFADSCNDIRHTADAPSLIPDALPGVTVPS